jgi:hypothetical protein
VRGILDELFSADIAQVTTLQAQPTFFSRLGPDSAKNALLSILAYIPGEGGWV